MTAFSPEFRFILDLLTGQQASSSQSLDPAKLIRLLDDHRVTPPIAAAGQIAAFPADTVAWMINHRALNSQSALLMAARMARLIAGLDQAGVTSIPVKGVALAQQLYGDVAHRHTGDIDLLIRRTDVDLASRVLLEMGFRSTLNAVDYRRRLRGRHHIEFVNKERLRLELHWAFSDRFWAIDFGLDDMLPDSQSIELAGQTVSVPAPHDLLPMLCIHGGKHQWHRLFWLVDIHRLVTATPDLNWREVYDRANALHVVRMLHIGLHLSHELLNTSLPEHILSHVQSDSDARSVADAMTHHLEASREETLTDQIRLRERRRDRFRFWLIRVTADDLKNRIEVTESADFRAWAYSYPTPLNEILRLLGWIWHTGFRVFGLLFDYFTTQISVFRHKVWFG